VRFAVYRHFRTMTGRFGTCQRRQDRYCDFETVHRREKIKRQEPDYYLCPAAEKFKLILTATPCRTLRHRRRPEVPSDKKANSIPRDDVFSISHSAGDFFENSNSGRKPDSDISQNKYKFLTITF